MRIRREKSHLDTGTALDYFEGRLSAAAVSRVESHLSGPCAACRERVRAVGRLFEAMRTDRVAAVPDAVREAALAAFSVSGERQPAAPRAWTWARLLFDSLGQPLPAAVRRSVGETRRLEFALGEHRLELEVEPESPRGWTLRGHLRLPDPELHRIEIAFGEERLEVWPDAAGNFAADAIPARAMRILVTGPTGRFRIQKFEK